MEQVIKVAIVESLQLVREGIIQLIEKSQEFKVVIEAENGKELIEKIEASNNLPHVCLLDVQMKIQDCCETLSILNKKYPKIKTIAVATDLEDYNLIRMVITGVNGLHSKEETGLNLINVIKEVYQKGNSPSINLFSQSLENYRTGKSKIPVFTKNEMEFIKYLCQDLSYKEIADRMIKSERTIDNYRNSLLKKLNASSKVGIVVFALNKLHVEV